MVDHSEGKDLPSISVESFEYFPGRGLTATVNNIEVCCYLTGYLNSVLLNWILKYSFCMTK